MASMAICEFPSVPFLKPTGMERPLAISRWIWLSVVRAPMAAHETRSAVYCGVMGSRNSVAASTPISASWRSSLRARKSPLEMSNEPSRLGSLMKPFQPSEVRGFSK